MEVCRLCLNYIQTPIDQVQVNYPLYETQIKLLLPEIDIKITPMYSLCRQCSDSLKESYIFRNKCIKTETLITKYLRDSKTTEIDLNSIKLKLDGSTILSHSAETRSVDDDNVNDEQFEDKQEVENESEEDNFMENDTVPDDDTSNTFACECCRLVFEDENIFHEHNKICNTATECKVEESSIDIVANDNFNSCTNNVGTDSTAQSNSSEPICKKRIRKKPEKRTYICELCDKQFSLHIKLKRHYKTHTGYEKIPCSVCNKSFNHKKGLQLHEKSHKGDTFECSICLKKYTTRIFLRNHIKRCHLKKYVCDSCIWTFGVKNNLLAHIRTHTGERPFTCEVCRKAFVQRSTLKTHFKSVHTQEKPYECQICHRTFSENGSLTKHSATHLDKDSKDFICERENCGKGFCTKLSLRDHVRRVHETLVNAYKCSLCGKALKSTRSLKRHMLCHTNEKPFECHICHKSFNQSYNVKIHMKSHQPKESRKIEKNS